MEWRVSCSTEDGQSKGTLGTQHPQSQIPVDFKGKNRNMPFPPAELGHQTGGAQPDLCTKPITQQRAVLQWLGHPQWYLSSAACQHPQAVLTLQPPTPPSTPSPTGPLQCCGHPQQCFGGAHPHPRGVLPHKPQPLH